MKKLDKFKWLKESNSQVLQQGLMDLYDSLKRFYKKQNKYPKFKSKYNGYQSFRFPQGIKVIGKNLISTPAFKKGIKTKIHIDISDMNLKSATISKEPSGKYYISIIVEHDGELPTPTTIEEDKSIGIDLGINHYAITSKGKKYDNPKWFRKSQDKLAKHQKMQARCKKGSKNRNKRKLLVAKVHEKVRNQRLDYQHKLTHELVYKSQDTTFVLETLSIKNMIKNRKLSKAISDCSWGQFVRILTYKSKLVGKNVIQINRFFPSSKTCSTCGDIRSHLPLNIREWECETCNEIHDRDINASINILKFGLKLPY